MTLRLTFSQFFENCCFPQCGQELTTWTIPVATMDSRSVKKSGCEHFSLRWVPRSLTDKLRPKQVKLAGKLL
jgi:hypothetical protein